MGKMLNTFSRSNVAFQEIWFLILSGAKEISMVCFCEGICFLNRFFQWNYLVVPISPPHPPPLFFSPHRDGTVLCWYAIICRYQWICRDSWTNSIFCLVSEQPLETSIAEVKFNFYRSRTNLNCSRSIMNMQRHGKKMVHADLVFG